MSFKSLENDQNNLDSQIFQEFSRFKNQVQSE